MTRSPPSGRINERALFGSQPALAQALPARLGIPSDSSWKPPKSRIIGTHAFIWCRKTALGIFLSPSVDSALSRSFQNPSESE